MTEGPTDVLTQAGVQRQQVVVEAHKHNFLKFGIFWKEIPFYHPQDASTDMEPVLPSRKPHFLFLYTILISSVAPPKHL